MRRTILVLAMTLLVTSGAMAGSEASAKTHPVPARHQAGSGPLADSVKGFSGTQGKKGWSYGYYANPPTPTFTAMTQYFGKSPDSGCSTNTWYEQCGTYWTLVTKKYMHPESTTTSGGRVPTNQWAVRRWTSSSATNITVSGQLANNACSGGDGVAGHIVVDGQEVWSGQVAPSDSKGVKFNVHTSIAIGSTVDFALDPLGNDFCDVSLFTAKIYAS